MGEHRADVGREGSGKPGADQLQPEGLVERRGEGPHVADGSGAAADHEAVAGLGVQHLLVEMLDDRFAHPLAQ